MARWLVVAAVALLVAGGLFTDRIVDDTFISLRYARHWAEGFGPVFNVGERVEGYTNFLWTALLAALHRLVPEESLPRAAQWAALLCGAGVVALAGRVAGRWFGALAGGLLALSLALHSPLIAWSTAGLETTLFTLLLLAALAIEASGPRRALAALPPLLLALATATRPDGIVFLPVLLGMRLLFPVEGRWRAALTGGLLFALLYAPYWFWRWRYYGDLVPNTFYAKVGGGAAQWWRGVGYVREYAATYGLWICALAAWGAWRGRGLPLQRLCAGFLAAGLFYVVSVGGESLGFYRFMVPLVPCLALLATAGAVDLVARLRAPLAARAATAALLLATAWCSARPLLGTALFPSASRKVEPRSGVAFPGNGSDHDFTWFDNYFVARQKVAAEWISAHAPPDALVAATPAGSIGWHLRQPVLDMLGLNDRHIAHVVIPDMGKGRAGHEKGDGRYVLSRRPRYLLLGNVAVFDHPIDDAEMETRLKFRSENEIWADPDFRRDYVRRCERVGERGPFQWFTFFERRAEASGS